MITKRYWLGLFYLFFCLLLHSSPTVEKVKSIVLKQQKQELEEIKKRQFFQGLLDQVDQFLAKILKKEILDYVIPFLILFLISLTILILIFFISRNLSFNYHKSSRINRLKKDFQADYYSERKIQSLIQAGQFSEAIVYLHRCTIFYLINEKVILRKNMTNHSILIQLKEQALKTAFRNIYTLSEQILFNHYQADEADFSGCHADYLAYFGLEQK